MNHLARYRRIVAVAGAVGAVMLTASVALAATFDLQILGSTTVYPSASHVYSNVFHPGPTGIDTTVCSGGCTGGVANDVGQGGSGAGIAAILAGNADVSDQSKPMTACSGGVGDDCSTLLKVSDIDQWVVGKDGITIIVNSPSLGGKVTALTVAQIASIYNCAIFNAPNHGLYSDINPAFPAAAIVAESRETTSGTYGDFLKFIGVSTASEQACQAAGHITRQNGNPGMQTATQNTNNAIAYVGLGFATATNLSIVGVDGGFGPVTPGVNTIDTKVRADAGGQACSASNLCYPFGRQLFMSTIKEGSLANAGVPAARTLNYARAIEFVNQALSLQGQQQFINEGEILLNTCNPTFPASGGGCGAGVPASQQNPVTASPCQSISPTPPIVGPSQTVCPQNIPKGDVNQDTHINILDVSLVGQFWSQTNPDAGWIVEDVNEDGAIAIADVSQIGSSWNVNWQKWVQ